MSDYRIEKDSMGEVKVPVDALYGAQTQRAIDNFPISGIRFSSSFIKAVGYIKKAAAEVNAELGLISAEKAKYIGLASDKVISGDYDNQFRIDIFQTGSGTSTNMNANEVITHVGNEIADKDGVDAKIHPNNDVNFGQSSNDVIPTAIRVASMLETANELMPALKHLESAFVIKGKEYAHVVKTGRTHLMDAMPVTIEQEFSGYGRQLELAYERLSDTLKRVAELPQGGTAVGTGINTHHEFGKRFAAKISELSGSKFIEAVNHFEAQSTVDAIVELSSQLKTLAVSLLKIANDLRWMNSGPNSGLGEIQLAALQPGSSIMPGKVNPVIEEATAMVAAQVIGNDATITIAGQSGNFELNVMLPVVAYNILQSIELLANTCRNFADRSVSKIVVREDHINSLISKNPILVTALNPLIGYDLAAKIAKKAFAENRSLKEVAMEMCDLSEAELDSALDPAKMTKGGFTE